MAVYDRSVLPSRPVPWVTATASRKQKQKSSEAGYASISTGVGSQSPSPSTSSSQNVLDAKRLLGTKRVGSPVVSPDGKSAVFHLSEYDFEAKKSNQQLWWADLALAATLDDEKIRAHVHLRKLAEGKQHNWASISSPQFSPCGNYLAFLSNRPTTTSDETNKDNNKNSVWRLPLDGPGEASLLAEFPVSVGDLEWTDHGGLAVSASVYVDEEGVEGMRKSNKDPMTMTAERVKALSEDEALGGLNAVLYSKLPIREWDRWLDAKMAHPFYVPADETDAGAVAFNASNARDLLEGVPTAVPSGAFGGSEVRENVKTQS
jgi:dipeptidyl aminopeptidase/acylaminoacyl peptidase